VSFRIDWNDFAGRIVYAVQQEGKHAFLRDLARNVLRGMMRTASEGRWNGGPPPYGYEVRDGRLVPGDPAQVEVVRWAFRVYADGELGVRGIATALNARGVCRPRGGAWRPTAVWDMLHNPHYTGDSVWNRLHEGKYHGVQGGAIVKAPRRQGVVEQTAAEDRVVLPGTHEALIDRDTFDRVASRLASHEPWHYRKGRPREGNGFLLTGLAYCGHCGAAMSGCIFPYQSKVYRRLVCSTYHSQGRVMCAGGRLDEMPLAEAVVRQVQADFLSPANLDKLQAVLHRRAKARQAGVPTQEKELRARLASLEAEVERGADRLLAEEDAALAPVLRARLQEKRRQQEEVRAQLAALGQARQQARDHGELVDRAVAYLRELGDHLGGDDPARWRKTFRQVVERADLYFTTVPHGKYTRRPFVKAEVVVRPDREIVRTVSSGLPLETLRQTLPLLAPDLVSRPSWRA
jgi:site-specific DNA recombinase